MPDPLLAALREHARYKDSFELRVGDGWLPLVRACHEAVVAEFPDYELFAIKQKYAELAFQAFPRPQGRPRTWTSDESDRLEAITDEFRERSMTVCEECGSPGEYRWIDGWATILCDEHAAVTRRTRARPGPP